MRNTVLNNKAHDFRDRLLLRGWSTKRATRFAAAYESRLNRRHNTVKTSHQHG